MIKSRKLNIKDLKKHKYDVFRLLQIVVDGTKLKSDGLVLESIHSLKKIASVDESEVRLKQLGVPFDREIGLKKLKEIYL